MLKTVLCLNCPSLSDEAQLKSKKVPVLEVTLSFRREHCRTQLYLLLRPACETCRN